MEKRRSAAAALAACLALSSFAQRAFAEEPGAAAPATPAAPAAPAAPGASGFSEVWAYLMAGEEKSLDPAYPVSDLVYFGAGMDSAGKLVGVPDRAKLGAYGGRVHLAVAELGNYALAHFCLDPAFPLRDQLLVDIALAARPYDGVQIDFEAIAKRDREYFVEFLGLLKALLGDKTLSVALAARKNEAGDALGYERIGKIVDRVMVMAYDEHWSTSEPGPVASMGWCREIAAYAVAKVGGPKLVMGLPFYGRAWADKSLSRAYKFSGLAALLAEKGIAAYEREDGIPFVSYSESVGVKVYFDDASSLAERLRLYRDASVRNVAFWRLGQEDPAMWAAVALERQAAQASAPALGETKVQ